MPTKKAMPAFTPADAESIQLRGAPDSLAGAKKPTDLNRTLELVLEQASRLSVTDAQLALDLDPGLPKVPAHQARLATAIESLVANAARSIRQSRSSEHSIGTIAISTAQAGDRVELRITDTGDGISKSDRSSVFAPASKDDSRVDLASAWRVIVEDHGGTVEFETEPGVGTTFIAALPLHWDDYRR